MTKTDCVHHWLIDTPNGPVSDGLCIKCGEEREFANWQPGTFHLDETEERAGHHNYRTPVNDQSWEIRA